MRGSLLLRTMCTVSARSQVIHAVCVWCVANDAILAALASLAAWRVFDDLKAPGAGARGRFTQGSRSSRPASPTIPIGL